MRATTCCILTLLLLAAFACNKNELTVAPSSTISPTISMTGKWGATWSGWFTNANGTLGGSMSLTENDSALSGWILLRGDTFNVARSVSSTSRLALLGSDGGYDYSITGTVNSSISSLDGQVRASHVGVIPKDTVGTATMIAYKHERPFIDHLRSVLSSVGAGPNSFRQNSASFPFHHPSKL